MKIKTRKLIAAITATALLGSALGVGTYAITKSNNDFGFKGTYDLNAFAAAEAQVGAIGDVSFDKTSILTVTSTDDANSDGKGDYTLFISAIDTSDLTSSLSGVKLGYKIGDKEYNGTNVGLSQLVYSSLTVKTGTTTDEAGATVDVTSTIKSADYAMTNNVNNGTATPYFVVAEVPTATVGTNVAELKIGLYNTYAYSADTLTAGPLESGTMAWTSEGSPFTVTVIGGSSLTVDSNSKDIDVYSYAQRLKLGGNGSISSRAVKVELDRKATVTVHGMSGSKGASRYLVVADSKGVAVDGDFLRNDGNAIGSDTITLEKGIYYFYSGEKGFSIYGLIIDVEVPTYTYVAEVPATCGAAGTAAHYLGSDGLLYTKSGDTYTNVNAADLVIPATGEHDTTDVAWTPDEVGHCHICNDCGIKVDYAEHTDTNGDGKCDVCDAKLATETELDIKDTNGNILCKVTVLGDSDDIAYEELAILIPVNEGYVLKNIIVDETPYTSGNIIIKSNSTIVATIEERKADVNFVMYVTESYGAGVELGRSANGEIIVSATTEITAKATSAITIVNDDGNGNNKPAYGVQSKGNPLTFTLVSGYTYTITVWMGSSGSGTRNVTLNGTTIATGAGSTCSPCTWSNLTAGTYDLTQNGNVRIAKILVVATPV